MCVTICGRFCPDEGAVAGYGNWIRAKYTAEWGVQIVGMIFQTRSRAGGVYMNTYEELQDQARANGIDVMDYEFNSPNIKGLGKYAPTPEIA